MGQYNKTGLHMEGAKLGSISRGNVSNYNMKHQTKIKMCVKKHAKPKYRNKEMVMESPRFGKNPLK